MTREPAKLLITVESVLDLADVLEDRRQRLADGEKNLDPLWRDDAFAFWQALHSRLGQDIDLPPETVAGLGNGATVQAVEAVQAVLEAAHKYFGVDRQRLLDVARNEGPPDTLVMGTTGDDATQGPDLTAT